jgi:hypothetical protein
MDERERRADLRRRAIATLAMVAAGMAILPDQGPPARAVRGAPPQVAPYPAPAPGLSLVRAKAGSAASGPGRPQAAVLRRKN